MRGPLNVNAQLSKDAQTVTIQAGPREGSLAMNMVLDIDQATMLYDLLGHALADSYGEEQYQEWLAKQAFNADGQLDQGGEVIPMHTMDKDLA